MGTFSSIDHKAAVQIQKLEVAVNPETSNNAGVLVDETADVLLEILAKKEFQVNVEAPIISLPAPIINIEVPKSEVRVEPACPHVQVPPAQIKIVKMTDDKLLWIAVIPSLCVLADIILRVLHR
jgi:hypothetical protein